MRLILLCLLTLASLAANSVLIRLSVVRYGADPALFAVVRVASGALVLAALVAASGRSWPRLMTRRRWWGAAMLAGYVVTFSLAYRTLDAGLGALLLFGWVQITVFVVVVARGQAVPLLKWIGAGVAFAGLVLLLWHGQGAASGRLRDMALICLSGVCWGVYTLLGQKDADPIAATAANFLLALPLTAPLALMATGGLGTGGLVLALISGGITSGLGYVLFYTVLPDLEPSVAAVGQLSVPVLATLGGLLLIGEAVTLRFVVSAALVLGGIGLSLMRRRQVTMGSSGS